MGHYVSETWGFLAVGLKWLGMRGMMYLDVSSCLKTLFISLLWGPLELTERISVKVTPDNISLAKTDC